MLLYCPQCQVPVAEFDLHARSVDATCAKCRFSYRFVGGNVDKRSTRQVTLQRQSTKRVGSYQREYEFRLKLGNGEFEVISLTVPGRDDWILVRRGDIVSVTYTMNGSQIEDTVAITDHTTGDRYPLAAPGAKSRTAALAFAVFLGLLMAFVLWVPFDVFILWSIAIATVLAVLAYFTASALLSPRRKLDIVSSALITDRQELLARKREVLLARARAADDMARKFGAREKLVSLQAKMVRVGSAAYKDQMKRVEDALRLIDDQIQLENRLVSEYDRLATMIEIEVETRGATDAIPAEVEKSMTSRRKEIDDVRERFDELESRLLANQEVSRLLLESEPR